MSDASKFENFYVKIIATLPWNATEIIRFLKHVRDLFFFEKNLNIFKKDKCDKFTAEIKCFSTKCLLPPKVKFAKITNNLIFEKLEYVDFCD